MLAYMQLYSVLRSFTLGYTEIPSSAPLTNSLNIKKLMFFLLLRVIKVT